MKPPSVKYFYCLAILIGGSNLVAQNEELAPEEVARLIPDKVKGYYQDEDPKSKQIRVGSLTYSLSEKKFVTGRQSIKILLFDFKNAPVMYTQALQDWSKTKAVESDSVTLRYISMETYSGWESYNRQTGPKIFLWICGRFFMMMSGQNVELNQLREVMQTIPLSKFPK